MTMTTCPIGKEGGGGDEVWCTLRLLSFRREEPQGRKDRATLSPTATTTQFSIQVTEHTPSNTAARRAAPLVVSVVQPVHRSPWGCGRRRFPWRAGYRRSLRLPLRRRRAQRVRHRPPTRPLPFECFIRRFLLLTR